MKTILAVLLTLAVTVYAAEMVQVAKCDDEGNCQISAEMLSKIIHAVEYWHDKAQSCRGA